MKLTDVVIGNQPDIILRFDQIIAEFASTKDLVKFEPTSTDTANAVRELRLGQCEGALEILKLILSKDDYHLCWHKYVDTKHDVGSAINTYDYKLKCFKYFTDQYLATGSVEDNDSWYNPETLRRNNISDLNMYHLQSFYDEWRKGLKNNNPFLVTLSSEVVRDMNPRGSCWCVEKENELTAEYSYRCNDCGFILQLRNKPNGSLQAEGYHYCPNCGKRMYILKLKEDKS